MSDSFDRVKEQFGGDGWNDLQIEASGRQVMFSVNGARMAELANYSGRSRGRTALQVLGYLDTQVMFKDVRIRQPGGSRTDPISVSVDSHSQSTVE